MVAVSEMSCISPFALSPAPSLTLFTLSNTNEITRLPAQNPPSVAPQVTDNDFQILSLVWRGPTGPSRTDLLSPWLLPSHAGLPLFAKLMELFPTAGSLHFSLSLEHSPDTC